MGRDKQIELFRLASVLLATAALSACDNATSGIEYDSTDRGVAMPEPKKAEREKCYGVALAQFNDCAARPNTDCAGTATKDKMPDRWKYSPAGQCESEGGSLVPGEPLDDE